MKIKTQIFENFENLPKVGEKITVSQKNTHHLKNVLRIKNGEFIKIIANSERIFIGKIVESKNNLICDILSIESITRKENKYQITVCFAICKQPQNELVAEKLTELGVKNIIFWGSEHTPFKLSEVEKKKDRLQAIIEGAARQSKQIFIPNCNIFKSINETLLFIDRNYSDHLILYGSLENERKRIKDLTFSSNNIFIFIGPEGDFSSNEYKVLRETAVPISLGNSILKAETSAIVATSQVLAMLDS